MTLAPYLHFQGTCEQALAFYGTVFDDPAPEIMRYSQMPGAEPGEGGERVLHGHVDTGTGLLMASDYPQGQPGDAQAGVSICLSYSDARRAEEVFERLSDGGAVIMPWGETFFSPAFGMVKDRFGTHWMVMIDAPEG